MNCNYHHVAALFEQSKAPPPTPVCFAMPPGEELKEFSHQAELVKLPYNVCWFECDYPAQSKIVHINTTRVGALAKNFEDGIRCTVFAKLLTRWDVVSSFDLQGDVVYPMSDVEYNNIEIGVSFANIMSRFLTLLNCKNVKRIEHKGSTEKQAIKRVKRGKQPLYSYWTLELSDLSSGNTHTGNGGSHASPRLHLRRGHPREYKPEHWTWVNPHAVGNKQLGVVHKEYNLVIP